MHEIFAQFLLSIYTIIIFSQMKPQINIHILPF